MEKEKHTKNQFTETGKRQLKKFAFSRIVIIILLLLLQAVFLGLLWNMMADYFVYSYWMAILMNFAAFTVIINRKGNPSYKLAWMFPILILPVFGILLYIFCEYQRVPRVANRKMEELRKRMTPYLMQEREVFEKLKEKNPQTANLAHYLYKEMQFPVYENTKIQYFSCGEEFYPAFLEALKKAENFIFMEYFAFSEGKMWREILEILKEKAAKGVEVRFLYDGTCSFNNPYNYAETLEQYGIHCHVFNQIRPILSTVQNNRDHRKITVIDGNTAFTGGINLEDAYINAEVRYGYWKDTVIQLTGDAVKSFTAMFLQAWNLSEKGIDNKEEYRYLSKKSSETEMKKETGFVIPYCDSPLDSDSTGESVYMDILYNAKKYVHIMTPYLILDHEMLTALTYAARCKDHYAGDSG